MAQVEPEAGGAIEPASGPGAIDGADRAALARAQEITDRYRERARSAATILTTVAGALVVALLGAATLQGHGAARGWGAAAAVLLLLASGLLIVASVAGARVSGARVPAAFWTVRRSVEGQSGADVTRRVRRVIGRLTDTAMLVAGAGLLSLLVALLLFVLKASDTTSVAVTFRNDPPFAAPCGPLPQTVRGRVESTALEADSPYLLLQLPARACGGATGRAVLVEKADVTVVRG